MEKKMNNENKTDRCYICGRTQKESEHYLDAILTNNNEINLKNQREKQQKIEENITTEKDKIESIISDVKNYPSYIQNMKFSTVKKEKSNLVSEFPEIDQIIRLTNSCRGDISIIEALNEVLDKQIQTTNLKLDREILSTNRMEEMNAITKQWFLQDINRGILSMRVPIKGKSSLGMKNQNKKSLDIILDWMNRYLLNFEDTYKFLSIAFEIISLKKDTNNISRNEENMAKIKKILEEKQDIIKKIYDKMLEKLKICFYQANGKISSLEVLRKDYYLPEYISVPICLVCHSLLSSFSE